ncbi:MAG: sugar phosphate isomerase/epimerase [Bacteroidales bacterium]|nr:sugar phosphate isomerase/epimerase [Bacteroidales bacterium]
MKTLKIITGLLLCLWISTSCTSSGTKTKAEQQGWQLSVQSYTFHLFTAIEALDKTAELGVKFIEIYPGQRMGEGFNDAVFGYQLNEEQRETLKKEAQARDVKIISSGVWTAQKEEWEAIFSFAKYMEMEFISAEPAREDWDLVEQLAEKYQVKVAVHNHPSENSYWKPEILLNSIEGRSSLLGACVDVGHYKRMGLEPVPSLKRLEGKIISLHFKDIAPKGEEETLEYVIWGEGILNVEKMMEELKRQNFKGYFTIEYEADWENNVPNIKESIEYFNKIASDLSGKEQL